MTHKLSYEGHILWRADISHISLKAQSVLLGISYFISQWILQLCPEHDVRLFTVVHTDFEVHVPNTCMYFIIVPSVGTMAISTL